MMKRFLSIFVALTMLLSLMAIGTVSAEATNLITNGSFDNGSYEGWVGNSQCTLSVVDGALLGTQGHKTWTPELTYDVDATSGKTYVFTGKIKAVDETVYNYHPIAKEYKLPDSDGKVAESWATNIETGKKMSSYGTTDNHIAMSAADGWVPFVRVFTTSSDTTTYSGKIKVGVFVTTSKSFYIDDLSLVEFDVKANIQGLDEVVPGNVVTYTVAGQNIGGNSVGVSGTSNQSFSLAEGTTGVELTDNGDGTCTVQVTDTNVTSFTLNASATVTSDYLDETTYPNGKTVTASKTIAVNNYLNLIPDGHFDESTVQGTWWRAYNNDGTTVFDIYNGAFRFSNQYGALKLDDIITPGATYAVRGKLKDIALDKWDQDKSTNITNEITVSAITSDDNVTVASRVPTATYGKTEVTGVNFDSWTDFEFTFTAPDNTKLSYLFFAGNDLVFAVDDLYLVKVPAAGEVGDTGDALVVNRTGKTGTAVCAFYNSNRLVKVITSDNDVFIAPYYGLSNATNAKVLVWDSLGGMNPGTNAPIEAIITK